ncbi:hypothetical protein AKJ41_03965 [candidate division MSBL1 archaeon SCGC-AAA259O05]|uniref:Uncharacterized protein n=1 Tax=candidate division MSBL1 archaeon SCGC-AAA259O05 TaxID=1698271 RepID=A0A133V2C5_9EURY|nr:hypothetical protein AKJ41_03965 [candidate division MSBL1 archaeon SCGC-AAA259O05]
MPEWIEFPIKDHNDFQEWKEERLNPYHPGRYPKNWEELPFWALLPRQLKSLERIKNKDV